MAPDDSQATTMNQPEFSALPQDTGQPGPHPDYLGPPGRRSITLFSRVILFWTRPRRRNRRPPGQSDFCDLSICFRLSISRRMRRSRPASTAT